MKKDELANKQLTAAEKVRKTALNTLVRFDFSDSPAHDFSA